MNEAGVKLDREPALCTYIWQSQTNASIRKIEDRVRIVTTKRHQMIEASYKLYILHIIFMLHIFKICVSHSVIIGVDGTGFSTRFLGNLLLFPSKLCLFRHVSNYDICSNWDVLRTMFFPTFLKWKDWKTISDGWNYKRQLCHGFGSWLRKNKYW